MILAGDIGGTSTRLGFFTIQKGQLQSLVEQIYPSREHKGLEAIAAAFIKTHQLKVQQACFGIAGPILDGKVNTPNLAWFIDSRNLAAHLGLPVAYLINDLEANAFGIGALQAKDLVVLQAGVPNATGNTAVISAGTGLGQAGLYWDGKRHLPFACEGGHCDFAPRNDLEADLLRYLLTKYEHVSYERILSGPGLVNIFEFLRDTKRGAVSDSLAKEMKLHDPASVISRSAMDKRDPICVQALDIFVSLYGADSGNLALKIMATGGVYVGGGIAPRIIEKLKGPLFLEGFLAKGRMRVLLERIPVKVIMNDKAALLGAARCAGMKADLL